MKMTAVSIAWAEQQEAQVYLSGADPLTYPTESVVTLLGKSKHAESGLAYDI